MKTEATPNHIKRRKIRETAMRRDVEYAPYIIRMSKTPKWTSGTLEFNSSFKVANNKEITYISLVQCW